MKKICGKCREEKELLDFYVRFRTKDKVYYQSYCKSCHSENVIETKGNSGGRKKMKRPDNCQICKKSFDEVKYGAKGKCQPCYNKKWRKDNYKPPEKNIKKGTHCLKCKVEFEPKGKLSYSAKGMCLGCYRKFCRENAYTHCIDCGSKLARPLIGGLCGLCKPLNVKHPKRRKHERPKTIDDIDCLPTHDLELIRRLMVKYKWGMQSYVDSFIVVDCYLNIYGYSQEFDTLDEESQIIEMLRRLKMVYDKCKLSVL